MFDVPFAARRRPMFGVSAALHSALAFALVVPPLLATQEPPEPEERMRPIVSVVTVHIGDAPAHAPEDLLRKGNRGRAPAPAVRATNQPRGGGAPLTQPKGPTEQLLAPAGDQSSSPIEETGARSATGSDGTSETDETGDDGGGGTCEGCKIISANAPGVTPPVALETPSPSYPELARHGHVEGVVVLEAIIGADGLVRDARILRSANVLLETSALDAVRRWRYRAATFRERTVPVYLTVVVTFSLK